MAIIVAVNVKLNIRLNTVASFIKKDAIVADIGTDHALLPIYLIQNGISPKVYAMDIAKLPLEGAKKNIFATHLEETVIPMISNGIELLPHDVTVITICGMGGKLISDILKKHFFKLKNVQQLILAPNIGGYSLRKTLHSLKLKIMKEKVVFEKDEYYEIIVVEPGVQTLSEHQFLMGYLSNFEDVDYKNKWLKEFEHLSKILQQIGENDFEKKAFIYNQIKMIQQQINLFN